MNGHYHVGVCHSPPAHMTLGHPYLPEIWGTDGRTSQNYKRDSLLVKLANMYRILDIYSINTAYILQIDYGQRILVV